MTCMDATLVELLNAFKSVAMTLALIVFLCGLRQRGAAPWGATPMEAWMTKLPQITLIFWILKIAATTLGETGGDLIAQTMNVGYLTSSLILVGVFGLTLVTQLSVKTCQPILYWTVILSTSMAGTTISDFMDRTLQLGYARGAAVLVTALAGVFVIWKFSGYSFNVVDVSSTGGELLYWSAILFSNTLGTAFGDYLADSSGLGFGGSALLVASGIVLIALAMRFTSISHTLLFWMAFVLTRPLGATVGDFFSKPAAKGGLGFGTIGSSAVLLAVLVALICYGYWQRRQVAFALAATPLPQASTP